MRKRFGTLSSILRGRNHAVKKENVLRLCVGLQLTVKEAEELLASYLCNELRAIRKT